MIFQNVKHAGIAVLFCLCASLLCAEDSTDDQAKEQAAVDTLVKANEMTNLHGMLSILAEESDQKALKPVGTITVDKVKYVIILMRDDQYKNLKDFDKQKASLMGFVSVKPDIGKVFYFDHIEVEAPMAPSKHKRGGF